MNYRDEDLIKLAFGELDETEAETLRKELAADAAASSQIGEYNWIKEGLSDLRPVPPMQYSTERLRDAILGEGLNVRKRNPLALILAWTPAGAFGVAAVITGVMLMRTGPESLVPANLQSETSLAQVAMQMDDLHRPLLAERAFRTLDDQVRASTEFKVGFAPVAEETAEPEPKDASPKVRFAAQPTRSAPAVRRETQRTLTPETPAAAPVMEVAAPETADAATEQAPPIVMIGSEDDARTGAPIATEVRFDANVVVGG